MKSLPPFTGDQELDYFLSEVHGLLSDKFAPTQEEVEEEVDDAVEVINEQIDEVYQYLKDHYPIYTIAKRFDHGDVSPKVIALFDEPVLVRAINITLLPSFNGPDSALKVGTATDPELFMAESDVNPLEGTIFHTTPGIEVPAGTEVLLFITPDTSTAGSGYVFIEFTPQLA